MNLFDFPLFSIDNLDHYIDKQYDGYQFYGCFNNSFPTGRPNDTDKINTDEFIQSIKNLKNKGAEFNYLLNGYIGNLNLSLFGKYFSWIIEVLKPDIITISDPRVYHFLKSKYGFQNFEISAICGIKTENEFKLYIDKNQIEMQNIKKIVLHHDFTVLNGNYKKFIDYLKSNEISPRVLVTESCYLKCIYRKTHYNSLLKAFKQADDEFIDFYQIHCILERLKQPMSLLDLSGFLLPEQLTTFSAITGVNNFKISGRSKSTQWIYNTFQSYLNIISPENLYDIIVFTAPFLDNFNMEVNNLFYLNSKAYFEMSSEIMEIDDINLRSRILQQKSIQFFNDGHLKINDPNSLYDIKNGEIVLLQKGDYIKLLENVLKDSKKTLNIPNYHYIY